MSIERPDATPAPALPGPGQSGSGQSGSGPPGVPGSPAEDRELALPPRRWGLGFSLLGLVGFVVVSIAASLGLLVLGVDPIAASVLATVLGWVPLAGLPLWLARTRGNGVRLDLRLEFRWIDLGIGVLTALCGFVLAAIFVVLYHQVTGGTPNSALGEEANTATRAWQVVLLAALAVCAPFAEEIHFRGMWWAALRRRRVAPVLTMLITSALFAIIHFEPQRVILLFAMGLALGFVRLRTDRLGGSIVAHLCINLISAIGLLASL